MLAAVLSCAMALSGTAYASPTSANKATPAVTPAQAWQQLEAGNRRFSTGAAQHPHQSAARRAEEAKSQHPIAVVVSCSDSRVPPELVFDEGIGDLFVVRTAGHRLDDLVLASIEYAVEHLHCGLVVVLGHERCGAVTAAVDAAAPQAAAASHGGPEGTGNHVPMLVRTLSDAVTATAQTPGDKVENAMAENVRIVVRGITSDSPYLAGRVSAGALKVVGARYDLDTGKVTTVGPATGGTTAK